MNIKYFRGYDSLVKRVIRFLVVLSMVSSLPLLGSGASADQLTGKCFQEFPDSAWANGQPDLVVNKLNPDLMLYHFEVSPVGRYDLGGVFPLYQVVQDGLWSAKVNSIQPYLVNLTYGDREDYRILKFAWLDSPDRIFSLNLVDVRVGAVNRTMQVNVKYVYKGKGCSDRSVAVSRAMNISPIPTYDLSNTPDSTLETLVSENSYHTNILDVKADVNRLRMIQTWMSLTKKLPMQMVFPKGYKFGSGSPSREMTLRELEGYNSIFKIKYGQTFTYFDSNDGCLTTPQGEKYVHLLYSEVYSVKKSAVCPVYLHIFLPDLYSSTPSESNPKPPTGQLVIKGWVANIKNPGSNKSPWISYGTYCFNGKIFKMIKGYGSKCPAGYVSTDY